MNILSAGCATKYTRNNKYVQGKGGEVQSCSNRSFKSSFTCADRAEHVLLGRNDLKEREKISYTSNRGGRGAKSTVPCKKRATADLHNRVSKLKYFPALCENVT